MRRFYIDFEKHTIEMSRPFAKKAGYFGSMEYDMLACAKNEYPNFEIVIRKQDSTANYYKCITQNFIEAYIQENDPEAFEEYMNIKLISCSFFQVQNWFVNKYLECEGAIYAAA